jgi:Tol biopolymer transport system component
VAFSSTAGNLSSLDNNNFEDVFVRDLQTGATTLISVNTNGTGSGDYDSFSPTISSDGRFVLFHSKADNVAAGSFGSKIENLFLCDLQTGTNYALTTGSLKFGIASASMTPDGRFVVFVGTPSGMGFGVYVWSSLAAAFVYSTNDSTASAVSISPDGQRIAYLTLLPGFTPNLAVADLTAGTNGIISAGAFASQAGMRFSADGQFLVYSTAAANAANDTNGKRDVYLYDFVNGTNLLVSRSFNSSSTPNSASDWPNISPDGHFVAYRSYSSNTVPNDFNVMPDLFLFDRVSGATAVLTLNAAGNGTPNQGSVQPLFSADGQSLVFQSWSSDLVGGDFNVAGDIFSLNLSTWPVITGSESPGSTNSGSIFYAQLIPPGVQSANPAVTWPLASGKTYRVQFKDNLSDPDWQDVNGDVTFVNGIGFITDLAPSPVQRFYRVLLNN